YDEIFRLCSEYGISFYSTLPCSYNLNFIQKLEDLDGKIIGNATKPLIHIPLVREESGLSLSAGAYLGGRKTAMVIQNQGLGNMVTLMLSLNSQLEGSYKIPNLLIISHRGLEGEKIQAQKPVGLKSKEILDLVGYKHCSVKPDSHLIKVKELLEDYDKGQSIAVLVEPDRSKSPKRIESRSSITRILRGTNIHEKKVKTTMTRHQVISKVIHHVENEFIVSNIGHPSRELHNIKDRAQNFYLTSCLGHSYTLALGLALSIDDIKEKIICFEGDGGLLMNAGSLSILAHKKPKNLILFLLDNGVWGSTGNTKTYALNDVNLSAVAQAYGFPESNTGIIFEVFVPNLDLALGGGGRYDQL
ncbi:MAG: thiamine pyrophosphate-dependent enzyme, partial [Candidatus Hermodarchaeota archaeon]